MNKYVLTEIFKKWESIPFTMPVEKIYLAGQQILEFQNILKQGILQALSSHPNRKEILTIFEELNDPLKATIDIIFMYAFYFGRELCSINVLPYLDNKTELEKNNTRFDNFSEDIKKIVFSMAEKIAYHIFKTIDLFCAVSNNESKKTEIRSQTIGCILDSLTKVILLGQLEETIRAKKIPVTYG